MGNSSGSAIKVNLFSVVSSIRMGSESIFFVFKKAIVSSRLITSKAKCLKPAASGLEGRFGGSGNENNSTI